MSPMFLFARDARSAKEWAQSHGLSSRQWRYIANRNVADGVNGIIVKVPGVESRRDAAEYLSALDGLNGVCGWVVTDIRLAE
jgi:hypothetical protein